MPKTQNKSRHSPRNVARPLSPEDITADMFITVHYYMIELINFGCSSNDFEPPRQFLTKWLPFDDPQTFKVVDVCLPFILIEQPNRKQRMVDVRRYRFVQISTSIGKHVWKKSKPKKCKHKNKKNTKRTKTK